MRAHPLLRRLALAAVLALPAGCGAKFDLPTESGGRDLIPSDGSYQMIATWAGWNGVRDLMINHSSGSQLYALYNTGGTGAAARGAVVEISRNTGAALGPPFPGLFNPVALCAGGDGAGSRGNRVFVLDQGDTCLARTNPANGTCDSTGGWPGRITDVERYWKVVEYDLLGAPKSSFRDTSVAFVNGIAADDQGHVYVSCVAIIMLPTSDPRVFERTFEHRVYRYLRGPGPQPNPYLIGPWHRDPNFEIRQGTGVGAVSEPRGLYWSGVAGPALFVADLGNFRIEKVRDGNVLLPAGRYYHSLDFPDAPALAEPLDVTADPAGYFFAADGAGAQVLRYSDRVPEYVQRVDVEPNASGLPLARPVAVAADSVYAYVADAGRGEIIRYRRRL